MSVVFNAKFGILANIQEGWHQGNRCWTGVGPFGAQNMFCSPKLSIDYQKKLQTNLFLDTYKPQNSLKRRLVFP